MPNICIQNNTLLINQLPKDGMTLQEIQKSYDHIKSIYSNKLELGSVDLEGINHKNYSVLAFLISFGEFCRDNNLKLKFSNITDDNLHNELTGIGIEPDGNITLEKIEKAKRKSIFQTAGESVYQICADFKKFAEFIGDVVYAVIYFIKHPRRLKYREILFYMDRSGMDGLPIVFLICFLIGLILAFQSIEQLAVFGLEIYVADLVALTMVKELGPLMVAVICIGRAGSSYAAEIGTMKVSEELDAMTTMGTKPIRVLVIPKMIALILVMPMLTIIGDVAGIFGGVVIGVPLCSVSFIEYMNRSLESLSISSIFESLTKAVIFAVIVAVVGCLKGIETENDAQGVGKATTSAVVTSILLVIIADFFITLCFPIILSLIGVGN